MSRTLQKSGREIPPVAILRAASQPGFPRGIILARAALPRANGVRSRPQTQKGYGFSLQIHS